MVELPQWGAIAIVVFVAVMCFGNGFIAGRSHESELQRRRRR